jgi:hypothetical protein
VVEIKRHRKNDLVPGLGDGQNGVHERHVAAGRHHDAQPVAPIDAVVAPQLRIDRGDQPRNSGAVLVAVGVRLRKRVARRVQRRLRRAVVHHALPEGNRPGGLLDQIADDGNDRGLDGVHSPRDSNALRRLHVGAA